MSKKTARVEKTRRIRRILKRVGDAITGNTPNLNRMNYGDGPTQTIAPAKTFATEEDREDFYLRR